MKSGPDRTVLTVTREAGLWRVDQEGEQFGHSADKEITKAAANRRARDMFDAGRPCQVRIAGENGLWLI